MSTKSKKKNTPEAPVYQVSAVDVSSKFERDAAWNEMMYNQQNLLSDYKTWAKEVVSYRDFETTKSAQQLKSCNDAYTLSMWMNCLTPLREGIDFHSIMGTWLSFKAMNAVNPDFKMDSSRMISNLRNQLAPQISAFCDAHPSFRKSIEAFDKSMSNGSSVNLNNEISQRIKTNSLDTMIMTPRQVAALKVNFMEQYYVDMRMYNPNKEEDVHKLEKLHSDYNTAMEHLEIIADNGGFDMSVVAAEERYIVGMKIQDNPAYANIFDETYDVYGARPEVQTNGNNVTWSGDFYTADGHAYTTGNNRFGAFTVRPVLSNIDVKAEELEHRSEQYAAMMYYLDSDDCVFSKDKCEFSKEKVKESMKEYKDSVFSLMKDDGYSDSVIKRLWTEKFSDHYKTSFDSYNPEISSVNTAFVTEMNRIIDKHCVQELGIEYVGDEKDDSKGSAERATMYNKLERKADSFDYLYGINNRDGATLLRDARQNLIDDMSAIDVSNLMFHTATNMSQGMNKNGDYNRNVNQRHASHEVDVEYVPTELKEVLQSNLNKSKKASDGESKERELPDAPDEQAEKSDEKDLSYV